MKPDLSILVCGTPTRAREKALPLIEKLEKQALFLPVEILYLLDNKKRSVGQKRQALLDIAKGKYVAYVDDDDDVGEEYIDAILSVIQAEEWTNISPDVITFDQACDIAGSYGVVRFGLGNPNQDFVPGHITLRNAWHVCAWKREIAQSVRFLDIMDGEDWAWAEQLCLKAQTSVHIDKVLHLYRFNPATTEATGKENPT